MKSLAVGEASSEELFSFGMENWRTDGVNWLDAGLLGGIGSLLSTELLIMPPL